MTRFGFLNYSIQRTRPSQIARKLPFAFSEKSCLLTRYKKGLSGRYGIILGLILGVFSAVSQNRPFKIRNKKPNWNSEG